MVFTTGSQTLKNFTLNSPGSTISLGSGLTINTSMTISNGTFDLKDYVLTLITNATLNEFAGNVVKSSTGGGYISLTLTINAPSSYNCQVGVTISTSENLGSTTVKSYH